MRYLTYQDAPSLGESFQKGVAPWILVLGGATLTDEERRERKTHHLEMIQGVISRMAQNSFLLKGWALTLAAALFTLAAEGGNPLLVAVATVPTVFFWYLDGFFLRQERLFRALYDDVAEDIRQETRNEVPLYQMETAKYSRDVDTVDKVMFSKTLWTFYVPLVMAETAAAIVLGSTDIPGVIRSMLC